MCGGGHFEGFTTVIQGDSSVQHQDAIFFKFVVNFCKEKMDVGTSVGSSPLFY